MNWPLDSSENLKNALREQGDSPEQAEELALTLMQLSQWQAPVPTPGETAQLLEQLKPYVPVRSPIRDALSNHRQDLRGELHMLLRLARAQVSILRPHFWVTSIFIVILGCFLMLNQTNVSHVLALQIIGPLLSYLGTASVFRGADTKTLELELACPPSPRQLTLARLVVVLGYDVSLGLLLSSALWTQGGEGFLTLTLHWLSPLLLVAGLTLLLSVRLPTRQAAITIYTAWLTLVLLFHIWQLGIAIQGLSNVLELGLGMVGLAALLITLLSLPRLMPDILSRLSVNS